jgi:hypothetical protein
LTPGGEESVPRGEGAVSREVRQGQRPRRRNDLPRSGGEWNAVRVRKGHTGFAKHRRIAGRLRVEQPRTSRASSEARIDERVRADDRLKRIVLFVRIAIHDEDLGLRPRRREVVVVLDRLRGDDREGRIEKLGLIEGDWVPTDGLVEEYDRAERDLEVPARWRQRRATTDSQHQPCHDDHKPTVRPQWEHGPTTTLHRHTLLSPAKAHPASVPHADRRRAEAQGAA